MQILERVPTAVREGTDFNVELIQDAKRLLDYNQPLQDQADEQKRRRLEKLFHELDVRPFTADSVLKYKEKKLAEAVRSTSHHWLYGWSFVVMAFTIINAIVCGISAHSAYVRQELVWPYVSWSLWLAAPVIVALLVADRWLVNPNALKPGDKRLWAWRRSHISAYGSPVPEYAQQTAVDIKRKLFEVTISVDELSLRNTTEPRVRTADPFLVVTYGGVDYYVEVWNEPGYRQQRET